MIARWRRKINVTKGYRPHVNPLAQAFPLKSQAKFLTPEERTWLSQTIAAEMGAGTMVLDPIEGLSSNDLAGGQDYFTAMRQNLAHLRTALQCEP